MITTDEVVEVIKGLDFDPDLACEFRPRRGGDACPNTAEWLMTCKVCRSTVAMCGPHKAQLDLWAEQGELFACPRVPQIVGHLEALDIFTPIAGAR